MQREMDAGGLLSQRSIFHGQGTLCTAFRGNSSQCNGRFIILISGKYICVNVCVCGCEDVCAGIWVCAAESIASQAM